MGQKQRSRILVIVKNEHRLEVSLCVNVSVTSVTCLS